MNPILGKLGFLGAALALGSCGGSGDSSLGSSGGVSSSSGGATVAITITAKDFAFQPTKLVWTPGEKIALTFVNAGQAEHSFTPAGGLPEVEAEGGKRKTITLTAPQSGSLTFHCKYHPATMQGGIVIGAGGAAGGAGTSPDSTAAPAGGYGG